MFAFPLWVACLLANTTFPDVDAPRNPNFSLYRIRYAHVVLECTVKDVSVRSWRDGYGLKVARLSDVVRLRGNAAPKEIASYMDLDLERFVGERMILCGYWLGESDLLGKPRMYLVPSDDAAFRREGDRWLQLPEAYNAPPVWVTDAEIEAIVAENEVPALTRGADQVVIGDVVAVIDSTIPAEAGSTYRVHKVVLEVDRVLKGNPKEGTTWFLVAWGPTRPPWGTVTPSSFGPGEKWIAFLKHDGAIHYPLGGVNGVLQLRGQTVLYDRKVKHRYNKSYLIKEVLESVEH